MTLEVDAGTVQYNNNNYSFSYTQDKLILYRQDSNYQTLGKFLTETSQDACANFLLGNLLDGYSVIFILHSSIPVRSLRSEVYEELIFKVDGVIKINSKHTKVGGLSITGDCINYIYPSSNAYTTRLTCDENMQNGRLFITTHTLKETKTTPFQITLDSKTVTIYFHTSVTYSSSLNKRYARQGEPPLKPFSVLRFEFEETNYYQFLYKLWRVAEKFLNFMTHRKEIGVLEGKLSTRENKRFISIGTMQIIKQAPKFSPGTFTNKRYLTFGDLNGKEKQLFQEIANDSIFLGHIIYSDRGRVTATDFVLLAAAFEWEYSYLSNRPKSKKTIEAEKQVEEFLNTGKKEHTGKAKEILKYLCKHISDASLSSLEAKIADACEQLSSIMASQRNSLYIQNNSWVFTEETSSYCAIGKRFSKQRNNFAHGNLNEAFIESTVVDFKFVQCLVLAMQLKRCQLDSTDIEQAVNTIFPTITIIVTDRKPNA